MVQEPAFAEWLSEPLHRLMIRRADYYGLENCMTAQNIVFVEKCSIITYMISRRLSSHLYELLSHSPAVVLLGPRQAGKTTLALEIGEQTASVYLDLEDENDRAKLANPSK